MTKRIILALAALVGSLLASPAFAACTNPLTVLNSASATVNMSVLQNGTDANCMYNLNTSYWAGTALGAMANYGTSPGAVAVPGVNAFVTNVPAVTQSGNWTMRNVGNAGAILDFAGQNAASPANAFLMGGQFNTAPTTITTGNASPLQLDSAGNLLVNIKSGAGGFAYADESVFTQGSTSVNPIGCLFINSYTAITTGHIGVLSCTSAGSLHTTVDNSNPNGLAAMASSSPVVVASDQKVSTQNASTPINISTATTTQLVALSGSTKIYVTAWDVIAGGTGNITLEYGTGASCGTGTTVLTGAYNLTAQAGISKGDGSAPVLIVPAGNALCALTSAAVQMSGSVTYQQF